MRAQVYIFLQQGIERVALIHIITYGLYYLLIQIDVLVLMNVTSLRQTQKFTGTAWEINPTIYLINSESAAFVQFIVYYDRIVLKYKFSQASNFMIY